MFSSDRWWVSLLSGRRSWDSVPLRSKKGPLIGTLLRVAWRFAAPAHAGGILFDAVGMLAALRSHAKSMRLALFRGRAACKHSPGRARTEWCGEVLR